MARSSPSSGLRSPSRPHTDWSRASPPCSSSGSRSPSCGCVPGASTRGCSSTRASMRLPWEFPSSGDVTILRRVRRIAVVLLALAFVPAAHASGPAVSIQASATSGRAPLSVTLTASGDPALYHWDLGDGTTADGPVVRHVYPAGRFVAQVTATGAGGTSQAQVTITSLGLTLGAPKVGSYGQRVRFHGRTVPSLKNVRVGLYRGEQRIASARTDKKGRLSLRGRVGAPGSQYTLRYAGATSNAVVLGVRPGLDT